MTGNDVEPRRLQIFVPMEKQLTRPLACGPILSVMLSPVLCVALPPAAYAQGVRSAQGDEHPTETMLPEKDDAVERVTVSAGVTAVSQYISRGVSFSDRPSLQPFVSVRVALPELTGGAVTKASVFAGTWNSIQGSKPGLGQPNDGAVPGWYETDLYAGASIELDKRWTVSGTYYRYVSPSASFPGYNDFELIVRFDDRSLWEGIVPLRGFRLSPSLRVTQEAGQPNRADALYVQPSLTIRFDLGDPQEPVGVAIPLVLGFSDSFYRDGRGGNPTFGYFRTGLTVSGKPFARSAKAVTVNGGFDLWRLNGRVASGLKEIEIVGRIGASWTW